MPILDNLVKPKVLPNFLVNANPTIDDADKYGTSLAMFTLITFRIALLMLRDGSDDVEALVVRMMHAPYSLELHTRWYKSAPESHPKIDAVYRELGAIFCGPFSLPALLPLALTPSHAFRRGTFARGRGRR